MRQFLFGESALEKSWSDVKRVVQCPHIYSKIRKSTIRQADAWASAKWGLPFDYINILRYLGVEIIDD